MRQLTGEMSSRELKEGFESAIFNGFGPNIEGIRSTATEIDVIAPQIADAERYSSLLKRSLRPVRSGMQIVRDIANMMIEWDAATGRRQDEPPAIEGGPTPDLTATHDS
jgi:hypothetical protein